MPHRTPSTGSHALHKPRPWWHYGHVWLLIAGPLAVVLAGIATVWLALRTPDPVLAEDYYRRGLEINRTLAERQRGLAPAQQARNHAATPQEQR